MSLSDLVPEVTVPQLPSVLGENTSDPHQDGIKG